MRDYDIPHETEVFRTRVSLRAIEDRRVEGLHVNSRFCLCQCCVRNRKCFKHALW